MSHPELDRLVADLSEKPALVAALKAEAPAAGNADQLSAVLRKHGYDVPSQSLASLSHHELSDADLANVVGGGGFDARLGTRILVGILTLGLSEIPNMHGKSAGGSITNPSQGSH